MRVLVSRLLVVTALLSGWFGQAHAMVVGYGSNYFRTSMEGVLAGAGIASAGVVNLNNAITVDALFLQRDTAIGATAKANVLAFLNAGGTVVTELTSSQFWFNNVLTGYAGTASGYAALNQANVVVDAASDLVLGLPASWAFDDPTNVTYVYTSIDPLFHTVIEKQGTPYGSVTIAATAAIGAGHAVAFFSDFADFNFYPGNTISNESQQLLINAVSFDGGSQHVPEPGTALLVGVALIALPAVRRRRHRQ